MFWRLIRESLWRPQYRRRALWAVVSVALGTAVAAAMLSVSLDVGDKIGRELQSLGANIVITPAADSLPVEIGGVDYRPVSEGSYIAESSLPLLKQIFWGNNILAFAPFLYVPARVAGPHPDVSRREQDTVLVGTWFDRAGVIPGDAEFRAGIRSLNPTWKLEGDWVEDAASLPGEAQAVLGRSLAETLGVRAGDSLTVIVNSSASGAPAETAKTAATAATAAARHPFRVVGILTTGGAEEQQIFAPLAWAQSLAGLPGQVRKVEVSALIKPEDESARRDPETMTPQEYDRWYCSPYISSIQHQITQALPGTVSRPIRPVSETQGSVLGKLTFLMGLLAVLALLAAALGIASLASLTVLERQREIGLMKALGARDSLVASLYLAEAAAQGIAGGFFGFVAGQFLAQAVGHAAFGSAVAMNWLLLPVTLLVAMGVSFAGTWIPLRQAMQCQPVTVLRGE